jgi:hypothetical protein
MATKSNGADDVTLDLRYTKDTKGTYVYTMVKDGVDIGGVYLQKLLFKAKPGEQMTMVISPKA